MWTDELKVEVVEAYKAKNPTPETTIEDLAEVAKDFGKTVNGVRMVLIKADAYIKKVVDSTTTKSDKPKKTSKSDSQNALKEVIEEAGCVVEDSIIEKLTGKAAVYFLETIKTIKG